MSLNYDRALLAKQCGDIIKTAERVRFELPWFAFAEWLRIKRLEETAKKIKEDFDEI